MCCNINTHSNSQVALWFCAVIVNQVTRIQKLAVLCNRLVAFCTAVWWEALLHSVGSFQSKNSCALCNSQCAFAFLRCAFWGVWRSATIWSKDRICCWFWSGTMDDCRDETTWPSCRQARWGHTHTTWNDKLASSRYLLSHRVCLQSSLDAQSVRVLVVSFGSLEGSRLWLEQTGCTFNIVLDPHRMVRVSFYFIFSVSLLAQY